VVIDDQRELVMRFAVLLRRPVRRRNQSGFALVAGLMVWVLLCGVTLIALLSMTMSSSKIAVQQAVDSRQTRAADSAMESAVNQIRMDPAGTIGRATAADDGTCVAGLGTGSGLDFTDEQGTEVRVTAECETSPQTLPDVPAGSTLPSVDLVGSSYRSAADVSDTVKWATDCTGAPSNNCYPWRLGIGVPNYNANQSTIAAQTPTLLHTADPTVPANDSTLQIAGNVNVRQGAAALVNPTDTPAASAVNVGGTYKQAANGLFNGTGGINNCGMLGPSFPWNVSGGRLIDSNDVIGAPECGTSVTTNDAGLSSPFLVSALTTQTVPACSGTVITLEPGRYRKDQTAVLNDRLDGSCGGRTFWFKPGNYWFDVDDTSNSARERNSLIIDDPTARVIFGEPANGNNATAAGTSVFPNACKENAAGVGIVLSPRTSLRHKRGQVAICDSSSQTTSNNPTAGSPPPAVYQDATVDGGWTGTPNASTSTLTMSGSSGWLAWGSSSVSGQGNSWVTDGSNGTATFSCTVILAGSCSADVTASAVGFGSGGTAPAGPIASSRVGSLDLIVRASANNSNGSFTASLLRDGESATQLTLYKNGATTPTCAQGYPSIPDSLSSSITNTLAYDLFSNQAETVSGIPRCDSLKNQLTRADLFNARVDVRYRTYTWVAFGFGSFNTNVKVDGLELRAGWDLTPTAGTNGSGWSNAENIVALDGASTGYTLSGCPAFGSCATATRSMTATGFDNVDTPQVPLDGNLLKAGIVVTGETTDQNFFTNGSFYDLAGKPDVSDNSTMTATVNLAGGGSCTASWSRIPFWGQGVYLDLLGAPGNCSSTLTNASQLVGASATLQIYIERNDWGANVKYGTRIDHLKISTVSGGSYTGAKAPNLVTENFGANAASRTSFNVFGPWSTPKNDVNVQWTGPSPEKADGTNVPVIGGTTVISALGSFVGAGGEAGVVCCAPTKPAERVVTLTAAVKQTDGSYVGRGTAVVRVRDVGGNGTSLSVQSWDLS
jgi:Tfp pilus assembly protein PilX